MARSKASNERETGLHVWLDNDNVDYLDDLCSQRWRSHKFRNKILDEIIREHREKFAGQRNASRARQ